jgi:hypothetical protein
MNYFITALLFSLSLYAEGFISWQPPVTKAAAQDHSQHSGRKVKQLQLHNSDPTASTEAYYLMSTLEKRELTLEDGLVTLPRTGVDNYHALVVNQTHENSVNSSVRYIYNYGRPSKTSPTKITEMKKSDLEIAPVLLPREHDRYTGSNSYKFELRFQDKKLPNTTVTFNTSNGSQETVQSDEDGEFKVTMPNDFKEVKPGIRANRPAEFILKASHMHEGTTYTTTLAMPYHVNPTDYWRTQTFAVVLLILGLIIGIYMLRNVTKKKKRKA